MRINKKATSDETERNRYPLPSGAFAIIALMKTGYTAPPIPQAELINPVTLAVRSGYIPAERLII